MPLEDKFQFLKPQPSFNHRSQTQTGQSFKSLLLCRSDVSFRLPWGGGYLVSAQTAPAMGVHPPSLAPGPQEAPPQYLKFSFRAVHFRPRFFFCWFFVFKQGFSHVPLLCVNNVNITCLSNELPRLFPGQSVPWTEGALLALVNLLTVQSLHPHSASCACLWSPASSACYSVGDRMVPPLPSPSLSLLGCLGSRPQGTCRLSVCSGP